MHNPFDPRTTDEPEPAHVDSPFSGATALATPNEDGVTLVEGRTFMLCSRSGDIAGPVEGLFVMDVRALSGWSLTVDGKRPEPLEVDRRSPFAATFVARCPPRPGRADSHLIVLRERRIGRGMTERITVENHGLTDEHVSVEIVAAADFADVFAVKERRVPGDRACRTANRPDGLRLSCDDAPGRATTLHGPGARVEDGRLRWDVVVGPGAEWETCIEVHVSVGGVLLEPRFPCSSEAEPVPVTRLMAWRERLPRVETDDHRLLGALQVAAEDLGALRIFDPDHPDEPVVAAGAPWFMTVFGRDSLLTAWMALIADTTLAAAVLKVLARFQGRHVDDATEEEPGKIVHELRLLDGNGPGLGDSDRYYGSIDATPLFVMLLGEYARWTGDDRLVDRLLPVADRALAWIDEFGDLDGDGLVEYRRRTPGGLSNQGWKDSWDAIRHPDGALAAAPIALCEVQGYVYAAFRARAELAARRGEPTVARRWSARAEQIRRRFNEQFWLPDLGTYALGLDADKRPIGAVASNVGHCLWTGIVDPDRALSVAEVLLGRAMFTGWGVRTLSDRMRAYNPISYHNGSVWPHDNAICAAGLARYGCTDHASRIISAQLDAATACGGRLPELFAGFDRDRIGIPARYPTSCSPQAWAAAAPLLWLRTLLRLDPCAPSGEVSLAPCLPPATRSLRVEGIRIGPCELTVDVRGDAVEVHGAAGYRVVTEPSPLPGGFGV